MKTNKLLTTFAIVSIATAVLTGGCKKPNTDPNSEIVIPVQSIEMATVLLAGTSTFVILDDNPVILP